MTQTTQATLATIPPRFLPWLDRKAQFSWLKAITLAIAIAPGLWVAFQLSMGLLTPKPVTLAIHQIGDWGIRFLIASLAVTPLRRILDYPKLLIIRRMLGVTAFAYILIHFVLYIVDQHWDLARVASEIIFRFYLTIGFVALLGLGALAATSTDKTIKRMGPEKWAKLHKLVYVIALIGLLHYFIQSKLLIDAALLMFGFYALVMLHREMQKRGVATKPLTLVGLGVVSAMVMAVVESAWYYFRNGVSPARTLGNNFNFLDGFHLADDFDWMTDFRPQWWIIAVAIILAGINFWRKRAKA